MNRHESLLPLYEDVFHARGDVIRLIVSPPCPNPPSREEQWNDPEAAFAKAAAARRGLPAAGRSPSPSRHHPRHPRRVRRVRPRHLRRMAQESNRST